MASLGAACASSAPLTSAAMRRERRRRAEARLRLALVRDGAALAGHRGGPSGSDLPHVAGLRYQVAALHDQVRLLHDQVRLLRALHRVCQEDFDDDHESDRVPLCPSPLPSPSLASSAASDVGDPDLVGEWMPLPNLPSPILAAREFKEHLTGNIIRFGDRTLADCPTCAVWAGHTSRWMPSDWARGVCPECSQAWHQRRGLLRSLARAAVSHGVASKD